MLLGIYLYWGGVTGDVGGAVHSHRSGKTKEVRILREMICRK